MAHSTSHARGHIRKHSRPPLPKQIHLVTAAREKSHAPAEPLLLRVAAVTLLVAVALTPLIVATSFVPDMFRTPKDLFFRAFAVVLATLAAMAAVHGHLRIRKPSLKTSVKTLAKTPPPLIVAVLVFAVATLTTLTSTNRAISVQSLITVGAAVILFGVTWWLAPRLHLISIVTLLVPALVNSVIVIAQARALWDPLNLQTGGLAARTALVGNSNDLGASLVAPILAAAAWWLVSRGRTRMALGAAIVLLLAGIVTSVSLTALGAMMTGFLAMAFVVSWRRGAVAMIAIAVVAGTLFLTYAPLRERATRIAGWLEAGQYNYVLSERLTPFLAAATMARDQPVVGLGPGTFRWHYMNYHWTLKQRYGGELLAQPWVYMYGQVHNDHLQLLAEGGVLAYGVFLAALATLAAVSLRRRAAADPRAQFAKLFALPFAAAFFVLAMAGFPLYLAVTTVTAVFLSTLVCRWSNDHDPVPAPAA